MKSTKGWLAAALVAAFVTGGARVGYGLEYNNKTSPHEITLVLYFHPGSLDHKQNRDSLARLNEDWKGYFQEAADAIWHYTSNQVAIKEVQVYRRSKPWPWDVEVDNQPATKTWPHSKVYNGWDWNTHASLPYDLEDVKPLPSHSMKESVRWAKKSQQIRG